MDSTKTKISLQIPSKEHIAMKIECAKNQIHLKDFVSELLLSQWEKYKKNKKDEK